MRVAGVDGCRAGWLVATADAASDGIVRNPHLLVVATFVEVLDLDVRRIAIDIPIGLFDTFTPGGRDCDREARKLLGPIRGSSVFSAPVRLALAADPWPMPMPRGIGLTLQAWAITRKVREVDDEISDSMEAGQRRTVPIVLETHPEVVFFDLNGGQPLAPRKRSRAGRETRQRLLQGAFRTWWQELEAPVGSKPDDLLDALACLWVAAAPEELLHSLPANSAAPRDARGVAMQIWRRTVGRIEPPQAKLGSGA